MGTAGKKTRVVDDETELHHILEGFDQTILMTKRTDGTDHLHGRPMHIVAVEEDHSVWFFTSIDAQMVHEAQLDTEAYIVGQTTTRQFVLRGWVAVTKDRARIDKYWSKSFEVWFPEGKHDSNLSVVKFTPREGEYWDTAGLKGVRYWVNAARAFVTRKAPEPISEHHGKVRM